MSTVKAIVTSKGQITLPKTIREVLELRTGDAVNFTIQSNGEVLMNKNEEDIKLEPLFNLLLLGLNTKNHITVSGSAGTGKTVFVSNFLLKYFANQKIGILEPFKELSEQVKTDIDRVVELKLDEMDIEYLDKQKLDLLVIQEQFLENTNLVTIINKLDTNLIIVKQHFSEKETACIGNHFSVRMDHRYKVSKIEQVTTDGTKFSKVPIYIA
jgi:AbrB family looped-hinge helix DNA binding protein